MSKKILTNLSRHPLLCMLVVLACIPITASAAEQPQFSGFLEDYSGFEQSPKVSGAWRYIKPGTTLADLKKYNKIMLEPIQVWVHDKARFKGVDPHQLAAMTDYFHAAIVKAMAPEYPVVTNPGDDVLRVNMAITGIIPVQPKRNPLGYIPIAFVLSKAKEAADSADGKESIELKASMEAAFLDSSTGERIFAFVDSHRGSDMMVDKDQADLDWESTKKALDFWATELRKRFDETHGKGTQDSPFDYLPMESAGG